MGEWHRGNVGDVFDTKLLRCCVRLVLRCCWPTTLPQTVPLSRRSFIETESEGHDWPSFELRNRIRFETSFLVRVLDDGGTSSESEW